MKNTLKKTLALAMCVLMFAGLLATPAFAAGKKSDAFFTWFKKAHEDYTNSIIKNPRTWEDFRTNSQLKWAFLVDFNNHKNDAMVEVAKEANQIDEATYLLLVEAQKLKEEEFRKLAAEEKAARDKAVAETEKARAEAWAACVNGEITGDQAYNQFLTNGQEAVEDAQRDLANAQEQYDAANKIIEDESEAVRKERERRQRELMEELERLRNAQPNA